MVGVDPEAVEAVERPQVRTSAPTEMRVAASSDPHALAVAIVGALHDARAVRLRVIGAAATAAALKAVTIAATVTRPRGHELAVVPGWINVKGQRGDDLSGMTFDIVKVEAGHGSDGDIPTARRVAAGDDAAEGVG